MSAAKPTPNQTELLAQYIGNLVEGRSDEEAIKAVRQALHKLQHKALQDTVAGTSWVEVHEETNDSLYYAETRARLKLARAAMAALNEAEV